jgi:hypothetical protein
MGGGDLPSTTDLQGMEEYASTPDHILKGMLESMMKTQAKYPDECAKLDSDEGDWHHGFNSGMLAAIRLIGGLEAGGEEAEFAIQEFPELDT